MLLISSFVHLQFLYVFAMASWLNQIRSLLKIEANPSKVIEVKPEKYSDRFITSREDGIVLYEPGGKDQEYYEILLLRPCSEIISSAYRLINSVVCEFYEILYSAKYCK